MAPPALLALFTLLGASAGSAATAVFLLTFGRRWVRAEVGKVADRVDALSARVARSEPRPSPAAGPPRTPERSSLTPMPAPTLIAVPDLGATTPGPSATIPTDSELGRRFGPIWQMAESGASAGAIARATGQPIGQVELILGLRRRLAGASGPAGRDDRP